jgi:Zn-dependent protease with chaperone function
MIMNLNEPISVSSLEREVIEERDRVLRRRKYLIFSACALSLTIPLVTQPVRTLALAANLLVLGTAIAAGMDIYFGQQARRGKMTRLDLDETNNPHLLASTLRDMCAQKGIRRPRVYLAKMPPRALAFSASGLRYDHLILNEDYFAAENLHVTTHVAGYDITYEHRLGVAAHEIGHLANKDSLWSPTAWFTGGLWASAFFHPMTFLTAFVSSLAVEKAKTRIDELRADLSGASVLGIRRFAELVKEPNLYVNLMQRVITRLSEMPLKERLLRGPKLLAWGSYYTIEGSRLFKSFRYPSDHEREQALRPLEQKVMERQAAAEHRPN